MRNLAVVALSRAGIAGVKVAELFGVRPEHVSRLRRQAEEGGSAGLVPPMGRPAKLDDKGRRRVYAMADDGRSGAEIAVAVGVSAATISRLLARRRPGEPERLELEPTSADAAGTDPAGTGPAGTDAAGTDLVDGPSVGCDVGRISEGQRDCGYAGAMLLHGFLDRAGAGEVLAGLPSGLARRYDAASLMCAATFGFALGASSAEGTKHLLATDAGALVGVERFPHLRTLRPRLSDLADAIDPLGLQTGLAKAMLDADDRPPEVFFVDDHFVAYTGAAPVAKGWNTRRRHAEAGRDDTVIVDDTWRAICFASGPPSGLSKTMWGPLEALRAICGDRRVTIGFDRGGAYPKVFAELDRRGFEWVTYRRAPLAVPTVAPRRSWVNIDGRRHYLVVADETVTIEGVGQVRQISIYEAGRVVLQVLTSDRTTPAAALAHRLRCRWCIENTFKYLEDHHGIGWLCDYRKDICPDSTMIANPERAAAKAVLGAAEKTVARLERAIGTTATVTGNDIATANADLARLSAELGPARAALDAARAALRPVPAKVPATDVDPDAKRATPATN
ncbi:MAG: putative transposase, partial [Actinomycetes bacterium]